MNQTTAGRPPANARPAIALSALPGPKPWPLVGNALQVDVPRIHQDLEAWAREYGPVFKIQLGRQKMLVLSDHEAIHVVMRERPEGFRRPSNLQVAIREMGATQGLFSAEGQAWHDQRRMVMSAFSPTHVRAYFPSMVRVAERLVRRWAQPAAHGEDIDLQADLMRFTVDVITGLAFGVETNTLESEGDIIQHHLDKIFPALFKRLNALFPYWRFVKLPADRDLDRSVGEVRKAIEGFITQAREQLRLHPARREQPTNLLEAMLVAADLPGSGVDDDDVAGNVFTMLLAGEDTTANTLAWLIHLLHRNPEALARAQQEVLDVAGSLQRLDMDLVGELPYLEACIHETMRLKPVAPFRVQEALHDTVVAGVEVPAGTLIWCVTREQCLEDAYFPHAGQFDPARWLPQAAPPLHPNAKRISTPFGSGPRVCPGRYLAMVEMKIAMVALLSAYDVVGVATPEGGEAREWMSFTMTPLGLRLRLRPRPGAYRPQNQADPT